MLRSRWTTLPSESAPTKLPSIDGLASLKIGCRLGEGAIWISDLGVYATVDIYGPSKLCPGPAVFLHNPYDATSTTKCFPVTSYCGTVVPRAKGGLLVALKNGIHALDIETGSLTFLTSECA